MRIVTMVRVYDARKASRLRSQLRQRLAQEPTQVVRFVCLVVKFRACVRTDE